MSIWKKREERFFFSVSGMLKERLKDSRQPGKRGEDYQ